MHDLKDLRKRRALSPLDWYLMLSMAAFLLGVPLVLAFLTALFMPLGLAYRPLSFTVYTFTQVAQGIFQWLWALSGAPGKTEQPDKSHNSTGLLVLLWRGRWLVYTASTM